MTTQPATARITAERYISSDYMLREQDAVWVKTWLVAGLAQDVSEPGDFFVFDIARESVLVARSEAGDLHAFYNVCQHRGARLVNVDRGILEGFTCPYHAWRYGNDGKLQHAPEEARFTQGLPCDQLSLKPLRVESWAGVVWVCMDPQAPSLDEYLGPIKALIEPYRSNDMRLIEDQTVHLDCNWKAVFDNFGELYHVEHIHPQHELIFDCPTSVSEYYEHGHTRVLIDGFTVNSRLPIPNEVPATMWSQMDVLGMNRQDYVGRVLDVRRDVQLKKRELGPALGYNYDRLSDAQLSDIVQYNIFPNSILVLQPEEFWILRTRPHATDPNKCYWDKFSLRMAPDKSDSANISFNLDAESLPQNWERPEHDEFSQQDIIEGRKTMTITIDQDIHFIRDVQKGMHSRGFSAAWLNEDEQRVQFFHDWLDQYMAD